MHVFVDDLYLRRLGQLCTWAESTWPAVGTVDRRGQPNALFMTLVGHTKGTEAIFLPILTDSFCLRVAQMPRSQGVAIFVVMTTTDRWQTDNRQTDKTDCFTPCACARGNKKNQCIYTYLMLGLLHKGVQYYNVHLFCLAYQCSALGATFCYLLSAMVGHGLVKKYFPERLKSWRAQAARHHDDMLWYIIFLRITPFLPNWFINLASPIIGVRLMPFFWGTFLGN